MECSCGWYFLQKLWNLQCQAARVKTRNGFRVPQRARPHQKGLHYFGWRLKKWKRSSHQQWAQKGPNYLIEDIRLSVTTNRGGPWSIHHKSGTDMLAKLWAVSVLLEHFLNADFQIFRPAWKKLRKARLRRNPLQQQNEWTKSIHVLNHWEIA